MNNFHDIAIVPNLTKSGAYQTSLKVIKKLRELGMRVFMPATLSERYPDSDIVWCRGNDILYSSCDMVLTIGGDGTMIHAARRAAPYGKPLLGINTGRLGFAAELEPNELDMLSRLQNGDYTIEKRMMLRITHLAANSTTELFAINDAVISRGSLRLVDIDVTLASDQRSICHYRADGLIISTPTGSSAYSLAAGGPVVEPTMKCMVMTPICSHALFARPVVFSHHSEISLRAYTDDNTEVFLSVDGAVTIRLGRSDIVNITSSDIYAELIKLKDKTFYRVLNDKFTEEDT